jgi:hypothetical protein
MKNSLYWSYNLPLQAWPRREDDEDENSPIVGYRILNYMPRKERCESLEIEELLGEQTQEEFFEAAADHLENLAKLFRNLAKKEIDTIYYPDKGMEKGE